MSTDPNVYIAIMKSAILATDKSFDAAYVKFEQALVKTPEAQIVWDCFEPAVKRAQVKRYFDRANWLVEQEKKPVVSEPEVRKTPVVSEAGVAHGTLSNPLPTFAPTVSETPTPPPAPRVIPTVTVRQPDPPPARPTGSVSAQPPRPAPVVRRPVPSGRTPHSARRMVIELGREPEYERYHDHRGNRLGSLTAEGLAVYIKKENSVALRHFAELLLQNMPQTSRMRDIVRNYVDKNTSHRLWDEAQTRAAA